MGGTLRAAGWRRNATTRREISGGRAASFCIPVTFSCVFLHPRLTSLGKGTFLQPSQPRVLQVSLVPLQPPCSPSSSSLLLQHLSVPPGCCRGEGSGSASCWGIGIETRIGTRRRRGCLLPRLGWGDCNCCYREGLPPCSETRKTRGWRWISLWHRGSLSFSLSDATYKKMKYIPNSPLCWLCCAPMVMQSSYLNL